MSIRKKMFLLAIVLVITITSSFVSYLYIRSPIDTIKMEQAILLSLEHNLVLEQAALLRFHLVPIDSGLASVTAIQQEVDTAFTSVQELEVLPHASQVIDESITKILALSRNRAGYVSDFSKSTTGLISLIDSHFGTSFRRVTIPMLTPTDMLRNRLPEVRSLFEDQIALVRSMTGILDSNLQSATELIAAQYEVIEGEIQKIDLVSMWFSLVAAAVSTLLGITVVFIAAGRMVRSIKILEHQMEQVATGVLTGYFQIPTKDELRELGDNLLYFLETLSDSIRNIKVESNRNLHAKNDLVSSSQETSHHLSSMDLLIKDFSQRIEILDNQIHGSRKAVQHISELIASISRYVESQVAMVEESSAAIEQMIASINSISTVSRMKLKAVEKLISASQDGEQRMNITINRTQEIDDKIDTIIEIAGVIQGISSKTNLLAMNAEIEAAHAGVYGKGFSVVAAEIRNLAEQTAENSSQISLFLAETVTAIRQTREASNEAHDSFMAMKLEIKNFVKSLSEISESAQELGTGSEQILSASQEIRKSTASLHQNAQDIRSEIDEINQGLTSTAGVSSHSLLFLQEIATGVSQSTEEMEELGTIADRLNETAEAIDQQLSYFTLRDDDE